MPDGATITVRTCHKPQELQGWSRKQLLVGQAQLAEVNASSAPEQAPSVQAAHLTYAHPLSVMFWS